MKNSYADVIHGLDNYLFLAGGAHRVYEYITGKLEIPSYSVLNFKLNLEKRKLFCNERGIKFLHTISPDKHSILKDKFPDQNIKSIGLFFASSFSSGEFLFMPNDELIDLSKSLQIYKRSDTHLSDLGSLYHAGMLVERLTGSSQLDFINQYLKSSSSKVVSYSGDLGSKLNPKFFSNEIIFPDPPAPNASFLHNNITGGNNGIIDLRTNPNASSNIRLIFFGDSFGRDICKWLQLWFSEIFFSGLQIFTVNWWIFFAQI